MMRCIFGRSGTVEGEVKREGDGAFPLGVWPLREVLYRADRCMKPKTALPVRPIGEAEGWSDDPADPAYNRLITLPHPHRHELLRRSDELYDLVVILGFNDDPPVPGRGSAVFLHCSRPDYAPTEGCIALARSDVESLIAGLAPGDDLEIRRA